MRLSEKEKKVREQFWGKVNNFSFFLKTFFSCVLNFFMDFPRFFANIFNFFTNVLRFFDSSMFQLAYYFIVFFITSSIKDLISYVISFMNFKFIYTISFYIVLILVAFHFILFTVIIPLSAKMEYWEYEFSFTDPLAIIRIIFLVFIIL